jgi:hypothetical protein
MVGAILTALREGNKAKTHGIPPFIPCHDENRGVTRQ